MRLCGAFAIVFCLSATAYAQNDRDGNWWLRRSGPERAFYVTGLFDGAQTFATLLLIAQTNGEDSARTGVRAMSAISEAVPSKATVGQIVEGLDELYKDFRNRQIPATSGAYIVIRQISGEPPDKIEAMLQRMRAAPR